MAAFQTLLGLTAQHEPTTYRTITQRAPDPLGANRIRISDEDADGRTRTRQQQQ
jgi:hypothetical protein